MNDGRRFENSEVPAAAAPQNFICVVLNLGGGFMVDLRLLCYEYWLRFRLLSLLNCVFFFLYIRVEEGSGGYWIVRPCDVD